MNSLLPNEGQQCAAQPTSAPRASAGLRAIDRRIRFLTCRLDKAEVVALHRGNDQIFLGARVNGGIGLLTTGRWFSWQWTCNGETMATINLRGEADKVVLNYRSRSAHHNVGEWESMNYAVRLDWTSCSFGGQRVWWRCPAAGCGRRVAVLHGGRVFACRQCNDLAYRCQRETDDDRANRWADTIRRRLGWEPGILNGNGVKPKGMHWRTLERLQRKYDAHVRAALVGMSAKLGLVRGRLWEEDFDSSGDT